MGILKVCLAKLILAGAFVTALLIPSKAVKANWIFDHMEVGPGKLRQFSRDYRGGKILPDDRNSEIGSSTDGARGYCWGSSSSTFNQFADSDHPGYPNSITCSATLKVSVHPVFRWEGEETYDPDTDEYVQERPPVEPFWIMERGIMSYAYRGAEQVTVSQEDNPINFLSPSIYAPNKSSNLPPYFHNIPFDGLYEGYTLEGLHFQRITPAVGSVLAYGPTRTFTRTFAADRAYFPDHNFTLAADLAFRYEVALVELGLSVREMPEGGGNAAYLPGHSGTITGLGNTTGILAGGVTDFQHKAEVFLWMQPAIWGYLPPICYPKVELKNQNGVNKSAKYTMSESLEPVWGDSDWSNWYDLYLGDLVSRDVTSVSPSVQGDLLAELQLGKRHNPQASVRMEGTAASWALGEDGTRPWNQDFISAGKGVFQETIWARVNGKNNLQLTGHNFEFKFDNLTVVTIPNTKKPEITVTTYFTSNPRDLLSMHDSESFKVVYKDDLSSTISSYATITTSEKGGGIYTGLLSVNKGNNWEVESFNLKIEDQGVYLKP